MKALNSMRLIAFFAVALFASPAAAQVGTSWDKKFTGANRFNVLGAFGNAAVFDKETGLVWELAPSTDTFTPSEAHRHLLRRKLTDIATQLFWEIVSAGVFPLSRNWLVCWTQLGESQP
jgi:hypothetical protein